VLSRRRGRRTVWAAVLLAAVSLAGLAGFFAGAELEERRSDRAEAALAAERGFWRSSFREVGDAWRGRDLCRARLEAEGTPTNDGVIGFFPSPELAECYEEQEREVDRYEARAEVRGGAGR
jgi:hypothetical protein